MKKPIVYIPGNIIDYAGMPAHAVRDTYIQSLISLCGALPMIIPAIGDKFSITDILDTVDGILLTGSPSNVSPDQYDGKLNFDSKWLDLARDATTLPLIREAIARDIPLIAICRGFQELNVATGGSLHQHIHKLPGRFDHRSDEHMPLAQSYLHQAHTVSRASGGLMEKMGLPEEFKVNSLHGQGVDRLGDGLFIEATAPDSTIEAVSVPGRKFILGTQWHPEADNSINETSRIIFEEFGKVLRA
jgi:putative glutamine amidotransferase